MESYVLKQICTQDKTWLRVYITILKDLVELVIFQKENAWKSTVLKKNLQPFAVEHKVTLESYGLKLLEYVKNATADVVFIFKNEEFVVNLLLKNSLQVKYFICKVEKVSYVQHVEQIMDKLYLDKTAFSEQSNVLRKENEEISKHKTQCEQKLNELINKKIADENEQLGQFILILNEKKRRIQHLTELLEAFKKGRPTVNPVINVTNKKRKREVKTAAPVQKEVISDSDSTVSNDAVSSDEHTSNSNSAEEKSTASADKPSTSTAAFDFLEDDFEQSHILPKRVKHSKSEQANIIIAPQPSTPPPQTEEADVTERSRSPGIDLSTQQLLDML